MYIKFEGNGMADTAKVFKNGRSQAVRIPKEYRFEGDEVRIYKSGNKVILEPIEKTEWPEGFWEQFQRDDEFTIPEPLPNASIDLH
jgi:antitoxin VapB